jgi:hypothetical protein
MDAMVRATATRAWLWFNYSFLLFPVAGIGMLVAAPFASGESALPLTVSGLWFILVGAGQAWVLRNVAHQVTVEGTEVSFAGPRMRVRVPVTDIVELRKRWRWLDPNALGFVLVRTRTHGTIKAAARMDAGAKVAGALSHANHQLSLGSAWAPPLGNRTGRFSLPWPGNRG